MGSHDGSPRRVCPCRLHLGPACIAARLHADAAVCARAEARSSPAEHTPRDCSEWPSTQRPAWSPAPLPWPRPGSAAGLHLVPLPPHGPSPSHPDASRASDDCADVCSGRTLLDRGSVSFRRPQRAVPRRTQLAATSTTSPWRRERRTGSDHRRSSTGGPKRASEFAATVPAPDRPRATHGGGHATRCQAPSPPSTALGMRVLIVRFSGRREREARCGSGRPGGPPVVPRNRFRARLDGAREVGGGVTVALRSSSPAVSTTSVAPCRAMEGELQEIGRAHV